jgi:ABC-type nitrate/sulfonate/bicarbonate transport system substrate-binding protein
MVASARQSLSAPGLTAVLALLLAACAPVTTTAPTQPAAPAATPARTSSPAAAQPASPAAAPWPGAKLVVAEHGLVSNAPIYVALEKGYYQEQGLEIELLRLQGGGEMIAPLASGQVDVAIGAPSAGLFNAIARDVPLRIVADKGSDFRGRGFVALVIRKDLIDSGAIRDYSDLKGRRLTLATRGTTNELDIARAAEKGGLTIDDVEVETMGYPDMLTALANRSVDGGIFVEPFVTQAVSRDLGVRWHGNEDFYPNAMRGVLMYGPKLVSQNPEAGTRFMIAYVKAARDYLDAFERGTDKETVVAALMKHTAVKDRAIYDRMDPAGIDRNGYANAEDMEYQQEWYVKMGLQPVPVDIGRIVDNTFADRALAVVGKQ